MANPRAKALGEDDLIVVEQTPGITAIASRRFDRVVIPHPIALPLREAHDGLVLATAKPNTIELSHYRGGQLAGQHIAGKRPRRLPPAEKLDLTVPWFAEVTPHEIEEALKRNNVRFLGILLGSDSLGYQDCWDGDAQLKARFISYRRS